MEHRRGFNRCPRPYRAFLFVEISRSNEAQDIPKANTSLSWAQKCRTIFEHQQVLYTVLRSPHIDKKSREQFEMEIKKQYLVIKTQPHELQKKCFWLKRQRIFGAQYELLFSCKTRLDKEQLQKSL
ncbi:hypothetical protein PRUPE_7G029400 [Prunus persica]|uniref:Small ribosomal subunit protein uS10 domain-containing protein n=1 Tax=Prunus persica TaxID=3760 RepID=A0A251N961_PRUPE|nr:hypothetical protein PRUPE_7G029400 [Prunus persica]